MKIHPLKQILINARLDHFVYIYEAGKGLISSNKFNFALSLLPNLNKSPKPATIFAWTNTDDPKLMFRDYIEQEEFIKFMNTVIRDSHDELRYLMGARAKRLDNGWIPLVDERATLIYGRTPDCDDTIGMCQVSNGQVLTETFSPMPTYRLLSTSGIFSLPKPIYKSLIMKLEDLNSSN